MQFERCQTLTDEYYSKQYKCQKKKDGQTINDKIKYAEKY